MSNPPTNVAKLNSKASIAANKVSEKVANLHRQNQSVQMIASKMTNDHEFISVVDLKNHKNSISNAAENAAAANGCTTEYKSKEQAGENSPCITASMKAINA